jgi:hypothetical protein
MTQVPTTPWSDESPAAYDEAEPIGSIEHVFTHFSLTLDVYRREADAPPSQKGWWSTPDHLREEAWPTVMVKVLKAALPEGSAQRSTKTSRPRSLKKKRLDGLLADFGAVIVDGDQHAVALGMPKGPAIAGLARFHQRAHLVDRPFMVTCWPACRRRARAPHGAPCHPPVPRPA